METVNNTLGTLDVAPGSYYFIVPYFEQIQRGLMALNFVINFLGIGANTCNIVVFAKIGILENATSISFFSLTVSDLTFLLLNFTYIILNVLDYLSVPTSVPYVFLMLILLSYTHMAYNFSVLITVYLTVQKCCCIAMPLRFQHVFTRTRSAVVIFILVILLAAWFVPVYATFGLRVVWDPRSNTTRQLIWFGPNRKEIMDTFDAFVQNVLPTTTQVIIIVCFVIILIKMKESSRFRSSTSSARHDGTTSKQKTDQLSGRELQVVKSVALVAAMFIICNFPSVCVTYATFIEPDFNDFQPLGYVYALLGSVRLTLFAACSSLNMAVYVTYNSRYRQQLFQWAGAGRLQDRGREISTTRTTDTA